MKTYGFSIIEVLVGISIFAIGVLALATVQFVSVKNIIRAGDETKDTYEIVTEAEEIIERGYESYHQGTNSENDGKYFTVIKVKNSMGNRIKEILVSKKNLKNGTEKKITLYLSK